MRKFEPLRLQHRALYGRVCGRNENSKFSFGQSYMWQPSYHIGICPHEDGLLFCSHVGEEPPHMVAPLLFDRNRSLGPDLFDRLLHDLLDTGRKSGAGKILLRQPDPHSPERPLRGADRVGEAAGRFRKRSRIHRVKPRDRIEQNPGVEHVVGHRPDLVETGGERHQAVAGDPPVGRLEPDHSAEGGRLTDRTAGVGPQRGRGERRRDTGRRTARRATGDPVRVARVAGLPESAVLTGGAHRELIHVQPPERNESLRLQPRHRG